MVYTEKTTFYVILHKTAKPNLYIKFPTLQTTTEHVFEAFRFPEEHKDAAQLAAKKLGSNWKVAKVEITLG